MPPDLGQVQRVLRVAGRALRTEPLALPSAVPAGRCAASRAVGDCWSEG